MRIIVLACMTVSSTVGAIVTGYTLGGPGGMILLIGINILALRYRWRHG